MLRTEKIKKAPKKLNTAEQFVQLMFKGGCNIAIIGRTGTGKSMLVSRAILPEVNDSNTFTIKNICDIEVSGDSEEEINKDYVDKFSKAFKSKQNIIIDGMLSHVLATSIVRAEACSSSRLNRYVVTSQENTAENFIKTLEYLFKKSCDRAVKLFARPKAENLFDMIVVMDDLGLSDRGERRLGISKIYTVVRTVGNSKYALELIMKYNSLIEDYEVLRLPDLAVLRDVESKLDEKDSKKFNKYILDMILSYKMG